MTLDPTLGHLMDGKQLQRLPAEPSNDDLINTINDLVNELNNNNRDIVGSDIIELILPTGQSQVVLPIPHHLGYAPRIFAQLNGVTLTVSGVAYPNINIPLPNYLNAAPDGSGNWVFKDWVQFFSDATNIYFLWNSGQLYAEDVGFPIKYLLTREAAN